MGLKDTLFGKTETPRQIPLDKIEAEKLDIEEQSERAIKAGRQLVQDNWFNVHQMLQRRLALSNKRFLQVF